jgi:hypothetical protein
MLEPAIPCARRLDRQDRPQARLDCPASASASRARAFAATALAASCLVSCIKGFR